MDKPNDDQLKIAIRYGELIRESMVGINAFDAAFAMRDLLAIARSELNKREMARTS